MARLPMGTARLVARQVKFFPVSVSMGRTGRKLRVVTRFLSGSSSYRTEMLIKMRDFLLTVRFSTVKVTESMVKCLVIGRICIVLKRS